MFAPASIVGGVLPLSTNFAHSISAGLGQFKLELLGKAEIIIAHPTYADHF